MFFYKHFSVMGAFQSFLIYICPSDRPSNSQIASVFLLLFVTSQLTTFSMSRSLEILCFLDLLELMFYQNFACCNIVKIPISSNSRCNTYQALEVKCVNVQYIWNSWIVNDATIRGVISKILPRLVPRNGALYKFFHYKQ